VVGGGLHRLVDCLNQSSASASSQTPVHAADKDAGEMAFFSRLTMPITAGPGCIAVTLTVGAHEWLKPLR